MNAPRYREVAGAILIDTLGRFLLQQRDDKPGIVQPGKIGLFGGHREDGETFLECVVREVHEEISYFIPAQRFEHLASLDKADTEISGGHVRAELFLARDIPIDTLVITEGDLLIANLDEVSEIESKLTPVARLAVESFFRKSLCGLFSADYHDTP